MKKICYIVTVPLSIRAFFIPQIKYLSANGFDVSVICNQDDLIENELGDAVHFYPCSVPRGISIFKTITTTVRFVKLFKKEAFDLVQYSTPNASLCASIASRIAKIPVRVYHLMGFRYLGAKSVSRGFLKFIEKLTCRFSTHIECVSPSNRALGIAEHIFPGDKAVVIWNGSSGGVDLTQFDCKKRVEWREEIRARLGISASDFVFGFVGRITKDKGVNEILEAFDKLQDQSKLLVLGDAEGIGTLKKDLIRKVRASGRAIFHSAVADVKKYYAAIDVLLLPSYREGFGNVVIEAGAMGTPAIISNIPGPTDAVIAGETALIVPAKDAAKLAEAMEQIQKMDVHALGARAATFVADNFSSTILCAKILERKRELLQ